MAIVVKHHAHCGRADVLVVQADALCAEALLAERAAPHVSQDVALGVLDSALQRDHFLRLDKLPGLPQHLRSCNGWPALHTFFTPRLTLV